MARAVAAIFLGFESRLGVTSHQKGFPLASLTQNKLNQ